MRESLCVGQWSGDLCDKMLCGRCHKQMIHARISLLSSLMQIGTELMSSAELSLERTRTLSFVYVLIESKFLTGSEIIPLMLSLGDQ